MHFFYALFRKTLLMLGYIFLIVSYILMLVYLTSSISLYDSLSERFEGLKNDLHAVSAQSQLLQMACQKPVNEAVVDTVQRSLTDAYASLVTDSDDLGKLLSIGTFCALDNISFQIRQTLFIKGTCPVLTPITDAQMYETIDKVDQDEGKIHASTEIFIKSRYHHYDEAICDNY